MAMIGPFDATNVAPAEDFSLIPVGEYPMHIVDSEVKPTRAGTGHYAELTFEVLDGQYKGLRAWVRLNLDNPNPKAVEIAQRELSAICHATGKLQINDTQELHYKPMLCRVDIEKREGYAPSNVVKSYKALEGAAAGAVGNAPTQQQGTAPTAGATAASPSSPPWAQKAA